MVSKLAFFWKLGSWVGITGRSWHYRKKFALLVNDLFPEQKHFTDRKNQNIIVHLWSRLWWLHISEFNNSKSRTMRIKVAWKLLRQKAWTLSSGITSSTQKMFWEQYFYNKKAVEAIPLFKCCRSNTTYQGLPLLQTWYLDLKRLYTTFILDIARDFIIHLHSFHRGYYSKCFSTFLPQSWLAQLPKGIFGSPQFALTKNVHCCFRHHGSCRHYLTSFQMS